MLSGTHGYVIAAISAWLIWRARPEVEAAGSAPSWPFVVVTALLSLAWYLTWASAIEVGTELLFPLILISAVVGVAGWRAARAVGLGIGFLVFAIPTWGHLSGHLRSLSARGVTALARLTGLPAYVEGNTVQIPSGALQIGGGCSGINYFIVAIAIATLYGELNRNELRHRVLLIAVAAAMAVVMNWVRIYGIVLNAYLTDMQGYLVTVDHLRYGWVLFGVLLVAFFWIARWLVPVGESSAPASPGVVAGSGPTITAFMFVLAALAIGPSLTAVVDHRRPSSTDVTLKLPAGSGGWFGPTERAAQWSPAFPQADVEVRGEYRYDDAAIEAYANAYAYQAQGHEFIGFGNDVLGASGWDATSVRRATARGSGAEIPYVEVTATAPSREPWVIAYVYSVGGKAFVRPIASKLYYGVAALADRPWSGVVAVASKCAVDCSGASAAVNGFIAEYGSRLVGGISQLRAET